MKEISAVVLGWILFVLVVTFGGFYSYSYFAPKYRAVDAEVFKQSEQYNDGMIRDLENLQMEYAKADDAHKAALKDIIIHRFSVYDQSKLPPNLFAFYSDLKAGRQ